MEQCSNVECEREATSAWLTACFKTVTLHVPLCDECSQALFQRLKEKQPIGYSVGSRPDK